jgi:hypothetical protein
MMPSGALSSQRPGTIQGCRSSSGAREGKYSTASPTMGNDTAMSVQAKARSRGATAGSCHSAPISGPASVAPISRNASVIHVAVIPRAPSAIISSAASV